MEKGPKLVVVICLKPNSRVATNLENMEKSGNLKVIREKSGKLCSCLWCVTATEKEYRVTASVADNIKQ